MREQRRVEHEARWAEGSTNSFPEAPLAAPKTDNDGGELVGAEHSHITTDTTPTTTTSLNLIDNEIVMQTPNNNKRIRQVETSPDSFPESQVKVQKDPKNLKASEDEVFPPLPNDDFENERTTNRMDISKNSSVTNRGFGDAPQSE